jgi:hypothetical protein
VEAEEEEERLTIGVASEGVEWPVWGVVEQVVDTVACDEWETFEEKAVIPGERGRDVGG